MDLWHDDWWIPKKGDYPLPCNSIESLTYDYTEKKGISHHNQSRLMILVHFPNLKYRQITHVQEYDVESLVGNVGGYIGLFLGYTLLHFPKFVISMFHIVKNKIVPGVQEVRRNTLRPKPSTRTERNEIRAMRSEDSVDNQSHDNSSLSDVKKQLHELTQRIKKISPNEVDYCQKIWARKHEVWGNWGSLLWLCGFGFTKLYTT